MDAPAVPELHGDALTLEAVRLALAAVFGQGAETREHVQLAADVVGEVQRLRAEREAALRKLSESEERRVTARREGDASLERLTALYRRADDGHDENMRETARLIRENERLQSRLDRALRACHIVTYGDGGITECADVVGELENSKRLDELNEENP